MSTKKPIKQQKEQQKDLQNTQNKTLTAKSVELSAAVPEVIAHRVSSFMFAGFKPNDAHHEEFNLMWSEKSDAFFDSWQAMAQQTSKVNREIYSSMMQTMFTPWWKMQSVEMYTPKKFNKAALSVLHKGLEPIHEATTSNAERLKSGRLVR